MTNKELISKSEVEKLVYSLRAGAISEFDLERQVESLPTLSPEAIIEEMIEESKTQWEGLGYDSGTLEEVLSRIRAENIS